MHSRKIIGLAGVVTRNGADGAGGNLRRIAGALTAIMVAVGMLSAAPAKAQGIDCNADLGYPAPGTPEWDAAYQNTQECYLERPETLASNPAFEAAREANAAAGTPAAMQASFTHYDPFRDPWVRWGGQRGDFREVTWTTRDGVVLEAYLYSPFEADIDGPLPGILLHSHVWGAFSGIPGSGTTTGWQWQAQALAEHGYVVMYADLSRMPGPDTADAVDWFFSTPAAPNPHNPAEFNPWHARLDRTRLGITGTMGGPGSPTIQRRQRSRSLTGKGT
jgi:hypothetical protein